LIQIKKGGNMNTVELIKKKRDGKILTTEEIEFLVKGYTNKEIPDYQFSSFLMAAFLRGLNKSETKALTNSMLYSGVVVDLSEIKGEKIDKHSTGGVGDKTSLILAPIVAAAGVKVPMISGRGLGHTGGTLDKLESIPGFRTNFSLKQYKKFISKHGLALIGQTKEIAPADKRIYALRDVTATVESIPFITASIMSKKLAEGAEGFVFDVKTGSGAFMKKLADAKTLANSLVGVAKKFKKKSIAYITDMNEPLGNYIGNWLEVYESIKVLQGEYVYNLSELSELLAGSMIWLGGKAKDVNEGIEIAKEMISSGAAFDKFLEIAEAQGGDISYLKNPDKYPKANIVETVYADKSGYLKSVDNYEIGMASLELGAGRLKAEDKIDPKAGIIFNIKIGDKVKKGQIIAQLFTDKKESVEKAVERINNAISFSKEKVNKIKLIKAVIK
jgi:pyrimidine-nucleoside phosphorylase